MMGNHLLDERFINKMSLLETQKPTGAGITVSGSRREFPNIQRSQQPMPLEAFKCQHPNNRNSKIQPAYVTGATSLRTLASMSNYAAPV